MNRIFRRGRRMGRGMGMGLGLALLAFGAIFSTASHAQSGPQPKELGTHGAWTAYYYTTKKGPVCYITSQPVKSELSRKGAKRDPAFFLVTHRPGDRVFGEVSTIIGYPFKKGSTPLVEIDGRKFRLFAVGDGAWTEGPTVDRQMVAAMKKGKQMTVYGTSRRGTKSMDVYSLKGVSAALALIDSKCRRK